MARRLGVGVGSGLGCGLKITIFGREPAAWLYALQALLAFAVTVPALGGSGGDGAGDDAPP